MSSSIRMESSESGSERYVYLANTEVVSTVQLTEDVMVDLDFDGAVVGVELLDDASIPVDELVRDYDLDNYSADTLRMLEEIREAGE